MKAKLFDQFVSLKCCLLFSAMGIVLMSFPPEAFAASDVHDIARNLRVVIGPLTTLVIVISYIAGIVLIFRGIGMFKAFGMPLTQASRPGEIAGPMVYLVVGAVLIWIPSSTDVVSTSLFGSQGLLWGENAFYQGGQGSRLLEYVPSGIEGDWSDLADTLVLYIQFIGFIAFVRGWFIIAKAGQPGVQPGSISKGIVHIIGGIIAVNFLPAVEVLRVTIFA